MVEQRDHLKFEQKNMYFGEKKKMIMSDYYCKNEVINLSISMK